MWVWAGQGCNLQIFTYHVIAAPALVGVGVCRICACARISYTNHHRLCVIKTAVGTVQLLLIIVSDAGLVALHFIAGPAGDILSRVSICQCLRAMMGSKG